MTGRQIIAAASVTLALRSVGAVAERSPTTRSSRCRSPPSTSPTSSGRRASRSTAPSSIPSAFEQCELTGRVALFDRAAAVLRGDATVDKRPPGYPFDETDLYKVIEGASYSLSVTADPKLDAYVDGLIAKIAAAQEPDGYLYTTRTIDPKNPHRWAGTERWVFERDDSHELYNLGHLFEAAVAHHLATGKRDAARRRDQGRRPARRDLRSRQAYDLARASDHRDGAREAVPRHRQRSYLDLAKFLLDERGPGPFPEGERANPRGLNYNQAHLKVDRAERAGRPRGSRGLHVFGHGGRRRGDRRSGDARGRQAHLGLPDHQQALSHRRHRRLGQRRSVRPAVRAAEHDRVQRDLRVGGHGLLEPPPVPARRRRQVHRRDGAHALQRPASPGVSLDGKTFFYPNPLESNGQHARQEWFGVACCPGNITRFMPSVPGYLYATRGDSLFVNLFARGHGRHRAARRRRSRLSRTRAIRGTAR